MQFLPAFGFLVYLSARGEGSFTSGGTGHALLLAVSGIVTARASDLLRQRGRTAAARPRVGLLQYVAPALMFMLGLFAFHEEMPPERWAGFVLVWVALAVLTWDALRTRRRAREQLRRAGRAAAERGSAQAGDGSPVPGAEVGTGTSAQGTATGLPNSER